jgi:hypothetical protein
MLHHRVIIPPERGGKNGFYAFANPAVLGKLKTIKKKEGKKMEILRDFWGFLKERKKWWLLPMIITLLLVGILIMSSGSVVAPFIYTLF